MEKKEQISEKAPERFVTYQLKAKSVLFDTHTNQPYIEQDTKEDLILALLTDIKNSIVKIEATIV